jgi:hypothetical protein
VAAEEPGLAYGQGARPGIHGGHSSSVPARQVRR